MSAGKKMVDKVKTVWKGIIEPVAVKPRATSFEKREAASEGQYFREQDKENIEKLRSEMYGKKISEKDMEKKEEKPVLDTNPTKSDW